MKPLIILLSISLFFTQCKKNKTPGANEVFIENIEYTPATLTVAKGTTVKWLNRESLTHSVSSDSTYFESGSFGENQSFSFTFNTLGTFPYHCSHHHTMKGKIIVQ